MTIKSAWKIVKDYLKNINNPKLIKAIEKIDDVLYYKIIEEERFIKFQKNLKEDSK